MEDVKLYQEELLDHYRHPRNYGEIKNADITTGNVNPSCGDSVSFFMTLDREKIKKIQFLATGCVISVATASKLCEYLMHKPVNSIELLESKDILNLIKIPLGPTRLRCALLSLEALIIGIQNYRNECAHAQ